MLSDTICQNSLKAVYPYHVLAVKETLFSFEIRKEASHFSFASGVKLQAITGALWGSLDAHLTEGYDTLPHGLCLCGRRSQQGDDLIQWLAVIFVSTLSSSVSKSLRLADFEAAACYAWVGFRGCNASFVLVVTTFEEVSSKLQAANYQGRKRQFIQWCNW